jgi:hypothetical protein
MRCNSLQGWQRQDTVRREAVRDHDFEQIASSAYNYQHLKTPTHSVIVSAVFDGHQLCLSLRDGG